MSWKIITEKLDRNSEVYIVSLKDEKGLDVISFKANGLSERTEITKSLALKYSRFIVKIEHL